MIFQARLRTTGPWPLEVKWDLLGQNGATDPGIADIPLGMPSEVKWLTLVIMREKRKGRCPCDSDVPAVINVEQPLTTEITHSHKHTSTLGETRTCFPFLSHGVQIIPAFIHLRKYRHKQHGLTVNTQTIQTVGIFTVKLNKVFSEAESCCLFLLLGFKGTGLKL